jgi:hypothetical protein
MRIIIALALSLLIATPYIEAQISFGQIQGINGAPTGGTPPKAQEAGSTTPDADKAIKEAIDALTKRRDAAGPAAEKRKLNAAIDGLNLLLGIDAPDGGKASKANFNKINVNMPYENVVKILGKGKESKAAQGTKNVTWNGEEAGSPIIIEIAFVLHKGFTINNPGGKVGASQPETWRVSKKSFNQRK